MKLLCTRCRVYYKRYGEMILLPGMVRSQFTFRPISPGRIQEDEDSVSDRGLDNRLSPASDRGGVESDSGRSYSSRSESRSGSRSPEEDVSRATTPGTMADTEVSQPEPVVAPPVGGGPSVTDIERDIDDEEDTPPPPADTQQKPADDSEFVFDDVKAEEEQDDCNEDTAAGRKVAVETEAAAAEAVPAAEVKLEGGGDSASSATTNISQSPPPPPPPPAASTYPPDPPPPGY